MPVSTVKTILVEDYSTSSERATVAHICKLNKQFLKRINIFLLQTQHGIIKTQQKFMEKEHRETAEYPAILKLYPHNSGYVATWLGGHRAE